MGYLSVMILCGFSCTPKFQPRSLWMGGEMRERPWSKALPGCTYVKLAGAHLELVALAVPKTDTPRLRGSEMVHGRCEIESNVIFS